MKRKKFYSPPKGQWQEPIERGYLMACCDCGLVHRMDFKVGKGLNGKPRAWFRVTARARNYTAKLRREMGVRIKSHSNQGAGEK